MSAAGTRGERTLARQHLERLLHEYPPQAARANAWYWLGRIAFESGDPGRGCTAIDSARALAGAADVELTNQLAGEVRRCSTVDRSQPASTPVPAATSNVPAPTSSAPAGTATAPPRARPAPAGQVTIQVGAYPSRAAADNVRKRLTSQGYLARVVPAGRYYRVRIGRYATRAAAAPIVAKLRAARNEAIIVDADPLP